MNLDETDLSIVELFQQDGRRGNRSVARDLGLSEGAIRKRLRRMEDLQTVVYGLIVDVEAADAAVWAWLEISTEPQLSDQIAEAVAALEYCVLCSLTSDHFQVRAVVGVSDRSSFEPAIDEIASIEGVRSVSAREIVGHSYHKFQTVLPSETWGMAD